MASSSRLAKACQTNPGLPTLALLWLALLGACASAAKSPTPSADCVQQANGYSSRPPCWLYDQPEQGLVLSGAKHVQGWNPTVAALVDEAKLEFASARYGSEVSLTSRVDVNISVTGADDVERSSSHKRLSVINSPEQSVLVKTELRDYYFQPQVERAWVWVMESTND